MPTHTLSLRHGAGKYATANQRGISNCNGTGEGERRQESERERKSIY